MTINHPAETEQVWVVDVPEHDEHIYQEATICNECGQSFVNFSDFDNHTLYDSSSPCFLAGWHDEMIVVGTNHVDEVGHYETIIVKEAWTETKQVCA